MGIVDVLTDSLLFVSNSKNKERERALVLVGIYLEKKKKKWWGERKAV